MCSRKDSFTYPCVIIDIHTNTRLKIQRLVSAQKQNSCVFSLEDINNIIMRLGSGGEIVQRRVSEKEKERWKEWKKLHTLRSRRPFCLSMYIHPFFQRSIPFNYVKYFIGNERSAFLSFVRLWFGERGRQNVLECLLLVQTSVEKNFHRHFWLAFQVFLYQITKSLCKKLNT